MIQANSATNLKMWCCSEAVVSWGMCHSATLQVWFSFWHYNRTYLMHVSRLFSPPEFAMRKVIFSPLIYSLQFRDVHWSKGCRSVQLQSLSWSYCALLFLLWRPVKRCWTQPGENNLNVLETHLPLWLCNSPQKPRRNDLHFYLEPICSFSSRGMPKPPPSPSALQMSQNAKVCGAGSSSQDSRESHLKLWSLHEKWVTKNHNILCLLWVVLSQVFIVFFLT